MGFINWIKNTFFADVKKSLEPNREPMVDDNSSSTLSVKRCDPKGDYCNTCGLHRTECQCIGKPTRWLTC